MFDDNDRFTNAENPSEPSEPEENSVEESKEEPSKTGENSSISSDLIRGHINTIILRALYERDKYGYEIMSDIEEKSHGQYTLKQPTLYSALKRLENQGYIKAFWKTDEVSSGGRRKYFTLTESGKEITEKNLAEWEYSRTIIDSLISDRAFDFNRPAPTPVDFSILRDSVSRVPVVKSDEVDRQNDEEAIEKVEDKPKVEETESKRVEDDSEELNRMQDEARRRVHENYLRLISTPVQQPVKEDVVPNSENLNSDKLLYNNKPETERDYKNLINGIFNRAISNGSVQTSYRRNEYSYQSTAPRREITFESAQISERSREDGVTVTSAAQADRQSTYAVKTTYDRGATLLKSSAIVLAVILLEFILTGIFVNQLNTSWAYPIVLLCLGIVQFGVFLVLKLKGFGKNTVIPTTHSYIGTCIVLTIITILIISALSFLLDTKFTVVSEVLKMLVIPSITALNITVFAVAYKFLIK